MSTALPSLPAYVGEDGVGAPPIVRTCRSIPIGLLLVANTVSSSRVVRTAAPWMLPTRRTHERIAFIGRGGGTKALLMTKKVHLVGVEATLKLFSRGATRRTTNEHPREYP